LTIPNKDPDSNFISFCQEENHDIQKELDNSGLVAWSNREAQLDCVAVDKLITRHPAQGYKQHGLEEHGVTSAGNE
jgi:hypothetical protein